MHAQAAAALDACLQLRRGGDGRRYLAEIAVFEADAEGYVRARPAALFDQSGRLRRESAFGRLERLVA